MTPLAVAHTRFWPCMLVITNTLVTSTQVIQVDLWRHGRANHPVAAYESAPDAIGRPGVAGGAADRLHMGGICVAAEARETL